MNRRIALVAALALTLGTLPLLAQAPGGGFGAGPRQGGPGRGGPGGPGGGPMGVLPGLNQLQLSDAQREQLRTLMEQRRQATDPAEKVREAEQALRTAVLADTPDLQAIEAAKSALTSLHAAELDDRVEMMEKIAQILTPAQRQQLAALAPPAGRGRGRGGPGGR